MLRRSTSVLLGAALATSVLVVGVPVPASAALIVADDFATLAAWTDVTRATIDTTIGNPAAPSMRVAPTAQSAFARLNLAAPVAQACVSVNVNLSTPGATGTDMFRLRTAANGPIMRLFVAGNGTLQLRNDLNPATRTTTTPLGTGWHNVELCGTIGAATSWTMYRDGDLVDTWATDTGTTPIGAIQLGDTASKTFVANFDHFVVDNAPGDESIPQDTTPPTVPGTPTGTSPSSSSIQIGWTASTDASTPITYRIYRDGGASPVGQTTGLTFTDTGLAAGSSHTYTVEAVDASPAANVSAKSPASASITVQTGPTDSTPPTTPGRPTGSSPSSSSIQIGWTASTDPSTPITYRVFRDGSATPVGQTTSLTFTDVALAAGSSHTYTVDAVDAAGNASMRSQESATITVQLAAPAVVLDDFANLSAWTVTRLTLDNSTGSPSVPSARAEVTSQSAFGARSIPPMTQACVSVNVNLVVGTSVDLFRLRTAANTALLKVMVASNGTLQMRNDLNPATRTTSTPLGTGWHNVELCGTVGAATSWTLYYDSVAVNTWTTNTGTTPIGLIQLGNTSPVTVTANYDHVVVDTAPGDSAPPPTDTTGPTVPGRPAGTSPTSNSIALSWTASTDPSTPITYRIYRDGGTTPVGQTTSLSFTDLGLVAGSAHTYTVDAVDGVGNVSAKSQVSLTITVLSAPPAVVFDDFANLSAWTVTRLTLSNSTGSPSVPSARAEVTSQSAFGVRILPATMTQACVSVNVNLVVGSSVDLFRLRTAANGALLKVMVASNGTLQMRNDLNPATRTTTTALGTGWHNVELCGTVGAATAWTLYRDNVAVNTWTTNTGTTPIGQIQLGNTSPVTVTANYDHFVVDSAPGDSSPPAADTTAPTVPGRPAGSSTSTVSIQIAWTASTDASMPITYRIYRDGGTTPVGQTTSLSFTDSGLDPGSAHTYTVDALDAAGNPSAKSQASLTITVQAASPRLVVDEFANLSGWTVTRVTLSTTAGSPSAPSARAQVTGQSGFAVRTLPATMSQACISANVNLAAGTGVDLIRLRTAINGALIKVMVAGDGTLQLRNDLNPATRTTTTQLGSGWHKVELCGTVGTATSWTLYRDNVAVTTWSTNTGTAPIGLVQLGNTSPVTYTANFDHFVVDTTPGD